MHRCWQVIFTDNYCPEGAQIVEKDKKVLKSVKSVTKKPDWFKEMLPHVERVKPLPGGQKVTSSSLLANAYRTYYRAISRCDRKKLTELELNKIADSADSVTRLSNAELRNVCKFAKETLPAPEFENATEVINGNKGRIQWITVKKNQKGTLELEDNVYFRKENGIWKGGKK
ncbi:MAG: hypothetical protein ACE5EH_12610 [Gammaproteobacteria bacterium]